MIPPDDGADDLVTVARFLEPTRAQIARGMLESAGIGSFLQGENANSLLAFAFRVRLKVRRADAAAARGLLDEAEAGVEDTTDDDEL